ncbi:hypothetical protein K8R43_05085 [archaeon]|nr:hypothetical protein [archaeon]
MKAIGIHREQDFAGNPEGDERILTLVGEELEREKVQVELKHPVEVTGKEKADLVFTMARSESTRQKISEIEKNGAIVVNNPKAIGESLNRELSYQRLKQAGARIPETYTKNISELTFEELNGHKFLKRADRHEQWFDVSTKPEFKAAMAFYKNHEAERVVVQKFIPGEHIKFYVIGNRAIFPEGTKNLTELAKQSIYGGKACGLEIYGGDFIVNEQAYLVDLNDWPSFGSVQGYTQEEAAKTIAEYLAQKLKQTK